MTKRLDGAEDGPSEGATPTAPTRSRQRVERAERCAWCGRPVEQPEGRGRPRRFCRAGCRQQAYQARRLAATHGLGPDEVIVDREALVDLQGRLYCLQAALEDVTRDLAVSSTPADIAEALAWLTENAEPLAEARLEPRMSAFI